MKSLTNTLYLAWIIGTKDIVDALKSKNLRMNIIIMTGMVVFFYWFGNLRPFDQDVSVVVYNEGSTNLILDTVTLENGAEYTFWEARSLEEMKQKMGHKQLGLVLPDDFDNKRATGSQLILHGYIFWGDRKHLAELEEKYSRDFSEILNLPVQVTIGENIIIPGADQDGIQVTIASQMVYFVFWTALALIPFLMIEEKTTKTMDALMISPASPGQIVLGKALAGFFYILIVGGLSVVLNRAYIVNWGLTLVAFLGYNLLAVGLGLFLGSFFNSTQQIRIWSLLLILFLVIPPLFYTAPNLKAGIRMILTWLPSTALTSLFRYGSSTGITAALFLKNLAVAVVTIAVVYLVLIWKVRQSDR